MERGPRRGPVAEQRLGLQSRRLPRRKVNLPHSRRLEWHGDVDDDATGERRGEAPRGARRGPSKAPRARRPPPRRRRTRCPCRQRPSRRAPRARPPFPSPCPRRAIPGSTSCPAFAQRSARPLPLFARTAQNRDPHGWGSLPCEALQRSLKSRASSDCRASFACPSPALPASRLSPYGGIPVLAPATISPASSSTGSRAKVSTLRDGDVIVVASKAVSRVPRGASSNLGHGGGVDRARELARETGKDERLVELDTPRVVGDLAGQAPGALVVRHKLGFVERGRGNRHEQRPPSAPPAREADGLEGPPGRGCSSCPRPRIGRPRPSARALTRATAGARRRRRSATRSAARSGSAPWAPPSASRGFPPSGTSAASPTSSSAASSTRSRRSPTRSPRRPTSSPGKAPRGGPSCSCAGSTFDVGEHGAHELVRPREKDLYA